MPKKITRKLLDWYDRHHRDLPWRVPPDAIRSGIKPDPYRVWLSEIMLQQTTVEAVRKYFLAFIKAWPTVADLASAHEEDVLKAWAGLGYYSRARNLKRAADAVMRDHGGRFPPSQAELSTLPGVGRYTSAAIASIAFSEAAAVVDGNVERVVTRLEAISTPLPAAKVAVYAYVESILPKDRPGDFAQACMDLGATICTPRKPKCILCPLRDDCAALKLGDPERFPVKLAKAAKPLRKGAAFVAVRRDGAVLLTKRADKGLLAGMSTIPTNGWTARQDGSTDQSDAPFESDWRHCGAVRHVFTHFELELSVFCAQTSAKAADRHWWSSADDLPHEALPTVFKKAIELALPDAMRKVLL
ncbi:MAG: A/G-specific adenine glycosylase [Rhizobiaceae bacterium]